MTEKRANLLVADALREVQVLRDVLDRFGPRSRHLAHIVVLTAERLVEADPDQVAALQEHAARARNEYLEIVDALRPLEVEIQRAKRRRRRA